MIDLTIVALVLFIALANFYFTRWFIRYAKVKRITDIPTKRSSHNVPTPRGGGFGFVVFIIVSLVAYALLKGIFLSTGFLVILISVTIVAFLGWLDDKNDLSKEFRFAVQSLAAILVIVFISNLDLFYLPFFGTVNLGIFGALLGLLWITATTNIFNFMDGVDGIASVQAFSAALGWAIFAYFWQVPLLLVINLFVIAGIVSFLFYNWSPAKIFMGDVGSVFLGFLFAIMPFIAAHFSEQVTIAETIWIAGILLWPFLFDGTFTILRRLYEGENVFEAHRTHLYQKLNIAGWTHAGISTLYLIISFLCIGLAAAFAITTDFIQVIIFATLLFGSLVFARYVYLNTGSEEIEKKEI